MNEISNVTAYRNFRNNLEAIASRLNAKAIRKPKEGSGVWHIVANDNKEVYIELTYTHYAHQSTPTVYVGAWNQQRKLSNLTIDNLKKHIAKHLEAKRVQAAEIAIEDAKQDAMAAAEDAMAKKIEIHGFEHKQDEMDTHRWESERGWFKLTFVHVTGTPGSFEYEYNFEYDLRTGPGREIHLKGEFDAVTSAQINRTIDALRAID